MQRPPVIRMIRLALLLCLLCPLSLQAQGLAGRVVEHRLSNGMQVLMLPRHHAPILSLSITYKVGSVNEHSGITGIAHLYEHMAFKGTETLGTSDYEKERPLLLEIEQVHEELLRETALGGAADRGKIEKLNQKIEALAAEAGRFVVVNELGNLYERNGAVGFNASTGRDVTSYTVSLPANRLPLWIAIESDRMAHPVMREFYKERQVVLEERLRSVETHPGGKLAEAFYSAAFVAHPYGDPTLGWPSDVGSLSATATAIFFRQYYAPSNAILAIVGDFEPDQVIPLLEAGFGVIPAGHFPSGVVTVEPPQRGERRIEIEDTANPQILIGYHRPGISHPDDAVFDVIDTLLSDGRSSRLHKRLVEEKKIAVSIHTGVGSPGAKYPNLFTVFATPKAPHTTAEIEAAVDLELNRLKSEPISQSELDTVITRIDAARIRSLRSNSGLAGQLGYFEAVAGSWRYLLENRDAIARVTPEDVMRVAQFYFSKTNRTVATLVQRARPGATAAESSVQKAPPTLSDR